MYCSRPPYLEQLNNITFWYPILERIGMRTPETKMFFAPSEIGHIVDGIVVSEFEQLIADVSRELVGFGGEAFLRTGHTSNKHEWADTCYLNNKDKVGSQLAALIEFSMLASMPYNTFAVRKMIKTKAITTAFNKMPIAQEVRMFIEDGEIICAHPYWSREAFVGQSGVSKEQIDKLNTLPDMTELNLMAKYVSKHFKGAWSVDFLQDENDEWWLTDMAQASSSYHYPDCPNINRWQE